MSILYLPLLSLFHLGTPGGARAAFGPLLFAAQSGPNVWSQCGEDNGIPLQYSCLENPMDGRAW